MVIIGSIRNRDRKCHGRCKRSEMTRESGEWTIVVIIESRREIGRSGGYWSEMVRCLRGWSHLSR